MDEMQKVHWRFSIGLVGCRREGELEIEADATDDDIDEAVMDEINQILDVYWEKSA